MKSTFEIYRVKHQFPIPKNILRTINGKVLFCDVLESLHAETRTSDMIGRKEHLKHLIVSILPVLGWVA